MAADPLRVHINETLTTIKQTFDDRSVSVAQVAYCYIIVANKLLAQHIDKRDSGAFLTSFDNVPLVKVTESGKKDLVKDRKYFELPGLIFDFDRDDGIDYVSYVSDGGPQCPPRFTVVPFQRTTIRQAWWLYMHPSTEPSPSNPYYYRVGNFIYTLGVEKTPIDKVEVGAYMTVDPLKEIDIDAPFNFPQELLEVLKRQVTDLIRYNWFFKSERSNDGTDNPNQQATIPKIVSVNDNQQ